jgi:3-dehydroquinate synthase
VGIKTGVNFDNSKNRLGTYFAPELTLLDPTFLTTLNGRHLSNGMAEILKIAIAKDRYLFGLLEAHGPRLLTTRFQSTDNPGENISVEVLCRAIQGMLEDLQCNLWEERLDRIVDYGHSFSPTLEMRALPDLLHGEAVAVDMAITTMVAWRRGMVGLFERDRILDAMRSLGLPLWHKICEPGVLIEGLIHTTQHRGGHQRIPLPVGVGDVVFINDLRISELFQAVTDIREVIGYE